MRIVIDTNVLLVSISPRSALHWLWLRVVQGQWEVYVTHDILQEYEEIIAQKMNPHIAGAVVDLLTDILSIHLIQKYYRWKLITADPDDDKFVDCAIAANADFLVTNDHHFDVLKTIPFPSVETISVEEFAHMLGY